MKRFLGYVVVASFCAVPLACVSTTIDREEPKLLVGRENDIRIDAQIQREKLQRNGSALISYEITNFRSTPIAIADVRPVTEYDPDSRTITIVVGSEVPGNELLPRLARLNSGEKKTFSAGARVAVPVSAGNGGVPSPRYIRLKVNFLGNIEPFVSLIDLPENAIADAAKADALFPAWVEANETVTTNAVTIVWAGDSGDDFVRRR